MIGSSTTRTTTALLDAMCSADPLAWQELDARLRPVLLGVGRRLGLDDADAADVAQETLACLLRDLRAGKYDRSRGRLRNWVLAIARYRAADVARRAARRREARGASAMADLSDDRRLSEAWDAEARQAMLRHAMQELRASTLQSRTVEIFERLTIQARSPAEVARELDVDIADVYSARKRAAAKFRSILDELATAYDQVL